jgi:hypothetical protein
MTAIPHQDLLVRVGSVMNIVAHESCKRIADLKQTSANTIVILTVALRLTTLDRQREGGVDRGRD